MKNRLILIYISTAFVLISTNIFGEHIFTKDGKIYEGKIISETSASVILKNENGKIKKFNRNLIIRILYSKLYMGKVYIQKNNGNILVCYIVDENNNEYIYRKDINKLKEFRIKKDTIRYIARGNPTELALKGEPGFNRVKLKWYAPLYKVKKYIVYLKVEGEKNFKPYDETRFTETTIKGLKSNVKYSVKVTAIDSDGDETSSSNWVQFTTSNKQPYPPSMVKYENISKKKNGIKYKLSWSEAVDSDGKVTAYRLYRVDNKVKNLVKEIKATKRKLKLEYIFRENDLLDIVIITAVDDGGAESKEKQIRIEKNKQKAMINDSKNESKHKRKVYLQADFMKVYPDQESYLYDLSESGYGLNMMIGFSDFLFRNIQAGLCVQYISFVPKSNYNYDENKLNTFILLPLAVNLGYSLCFFENFTILPSVDIGGVLVYLDYDYLDFETSMQENKKLYQISGLLSGKLEMRYEFSEKIFFDIMAQYALMYEAGNYINYSTIGFGGGFRF